MSGLNNTTQSLVHLRTWSSLFSYASTVPGSWSARRHPKYHNTHQANALIRKNVNINSLVLRWSVLQLRQLVYFNYTTRTYKPQNNCSVTNQHSKNTMAMNVCTHQYHCLVLIFQNKWMVYLK